MPDLTFNGLNASVARARDFEDELRALIPRYRRQRKRSGDALQVLRSWVRIHLNMPDDEIGCLTLRELEQEIAIYLDEEERKVGAVKKRPGRARSGAGPAPKQSRMPKSERDKFKAGLNEARTAKLSPVETAQLLTRDGFKIPHNGRWWTPAELFREDRRYYGVFVSRTLNGK